MIVASIERLREYCSGSEGACGYERATPSNWGGLKVDKLIFLSWVLLISYR